MTKTRPARPPTARPPSAPTERSTDDLVATGKTRPGRTWSLAAVAGAVLVVLALALVWRGFSNLRENDAPRSGGIQPIAQLESPDVHSLLIDPADPDRVLFGSHSGIQESRDGGYTWQTGGLKNTDAMSLSASPKEGATLYAAGHDVFSVSRDSGETWEPVRHDLPGTDIHAFAQDPFDPNRLFAYVVGAGVLTSMDGGVRWTPLATQPPDGGSQIALATNGSGLYATTTTGLAVSVDRGTSWQPTRAQPGGVISLAAPADDPRLLYAGTPNGLVKSADGGTTWTPIGPRDVTVVVAVATTPTATGRVLFVTQTGALYRSDDAGATWREPR